MYSKLLFTLVFLLSASTLVLAEFPAEEAWNVEFEGRITVLGPHWEEGGQYYFLIGLQSGIAIVSEGEIVYEYSRIDGTVTALNMIDFGTGDGAEILASYLREEQGYITRLSGDEFDDRTDYGCNRFGTFESDNMGFSEYNNRSHIRYIGSFQADYPDSSKKMIVANEYGGSWSSSGGQWYSYGTVTSGEFHSVQDDGNDVDFLTSTGNPHTVIHKVDDQHEKLFVGHSLLSSSSGLGDQGAYRSYTRRCGVSSFNSDMELVSRRILSEYEDEQEGHWQSNHVALASAPYGDEDKLFAMYMNSDNEACIQRLDCETLDREATLNDIDDIRGTFTLSNYQWEDGDNAGNALICINEEGEILQVNVEPFTVVDYYSFEISHVASAIDDFDGDDDQELIYLSQNSVHLFDVAALSELVTHQPYTPTAYSIQSAYPNPFNSKVMIEYTLPRAGRYALIVYDVNGSEITRLADEWRMGGEYRTIWNASGVASGTYFIKLGVEGQGNTKAIHLIR